MASPQFIEVRVLNKETKNIEPILLNPNQIVIVRNNDNTTSEKFSFSDTDMLTVTCVGGKEIVIFGDDYRREMAQL